MIKFQTSMAQKDRYLYLYLSIDLPTYLYPAQFPYILEA